jgi:hypothetical protein
MTYSTSEQALTQQALIHLAPFVSQMGGVR